MSEESVVKIISHLHDLKNGVDKMDNQLKIIDKRLSLIEQRLTNIEPWISVQNDHLKYDPAKHAVA